MIINGNLTFSSPGAGELQNAVLERLTTAERTGATHVAGRIVYDTELATYYFSDGTLWEAFGDSGSVTAVQDNVDAIETASGGIFASDGTYGAAAVDALGNITGSTDLLDALTQLDAAITAAAGVDTLTELDDVTVDALAIGEVLVSDSTSTWVNQTLAEAGIEPADATILKDADIGTSVQAFDTALDNLSAVSGTGFLIQTGVDTFLTTSLAASTTAGGQGLSLTDADGLLDDPTFGLDVDGLTAEAGIISGTDTFPMFDGTNNVKTSITQLTAGILVVGVALDDLSNVDDLAAKTADLPVMFMGDGTNLDTVTLLGGDDLTVVSASGTSVTLNVDDVFLRNTGDTLTAGTLTIASGASIVVANGGDITAVDAPTSPNDLTNKAYVDSLVAAGASWKNPVVDSDLVDVVAVVPSSPEADYGLGVGDNVAFIATAGFTFTLGVGTDVVASAGDIVNLTITSTGNGDYTLIETPLTAGDRFIVGAEHGSAVGIRDGALGSIDVGGDDAVITTTNFVIGDTYEILVVGDTIFTAIGASANTVGVSFVATGVGGGTTGTATDITNNIKKNDLIQYTGTGGGSTAASWDFPDGRSGLAAGETEIEQGVTVLNSDPESVHYGHTFLYNAAGDEWVEIAGPSSIGAGTGLSYTGNTLNVGMGAGVIALPADEVGIDVRPNSGLITTLDGTSSDVTTSAQLAILNDVTTNATLALSGSGIRVADGGILNAQVGSAAAIDYSKLATLSSGNILVGSSGGVATSVAMSGDVTIDNSGVTLIGAGAVDNSMMANSGITIVADTGTDAIALGETLMIDGNDTQGVSVDITTNTLSITVGDATTTVKGVSSFNTDQFSVASGAVSLAATTDDLTDITGGAAAAGDIIVATGVGAYAPKQIHFVYDGTGAAATSHTVTHNLGQQYCNVTVVDAGNEVIIPNSIELTTANELVVTFNVAITCRVIVTGV